MASRHEEQATSGLVRYTQPLQDSHTARAHPTRPECPQVCMCGRQGKWRSSGQIQSTLGKQCKSIALITLRQAIAVEVVGENHKIESQRDLSLNPDPASFLGKLSNVLESQLISSGGCSPTQEWERGMRMWGLQTLWTRRCQHCAQNVGARDQLGLCSQGVGCSEQAGQKGPMRRQTLLHR